MKPFVPFLRFPMMSTQSLLDDVLPVHGQLFAENNNFLHIVLYKMCAEQRQSDLDGPFPLRTTRCQPTLELSVQSLFKGAMDTRTQ